MGARPLLKKVQYNWWPPKQYQLFNIGLFDIYPTQWNDAELKKLLKDPPQQIQTNATSAA